MKHLLILLSIFLFSLTIISCGSSSDDGSKSTDNTTTTDDDTTTDTTAPVIAEVTAVTTPTNDTTPDYTFSSSEAGTVSYGGSCSSSTTSATTDNNTITLVSLSEGTYSDCTITVTDNSGNSVTLNMSSFVIDTTAPSTSIGCPAYIGGCYVTHPINDNTPDFIITSSEAGTITYYGSCSSSTTSVTSGTNTVTYNTLSDGTYTDCTCRVTDSAGNVSNFLFFRFVLDSTAPTVYSISPTDNQSSVSITDNITVTFSEGMESSYVTSSTSDTNCAGTMRVSSDNFSSCVKMSSEPASSNSNMTFTLDPYDNLSYSTTYKIIVTTGVKDTAGNTLSSQYETSSGFTTGAPPSFVAVGLSGNIVRSTDNGSSFDNATIDNSTTNHLIGVTFGNNTFVAVGFNGNIVRSTNNGSSWDNATSPTAGGIWGVTFGNNTFIAVGLSGNIVRSTDNGSSWDNTTSPTANDLNASTFGNNTFVAVGNSGNIVRSTDNGSSWDNVTSPTIYNLWGVTFGNNTFMAVGYNGNIVRSTDNGSTWDNVTSPTSNTLRGVTFGNNTFVVVGYTGNIVRSTDNGSTWDNVTSPTSNTPTSNTLMGVTFSQ